MKTILKNNLKFTRSTLGIKMQTQVNKEKNNAKKPLHIQSDYKII